MQQNTRILRTMLPALVVGGALLFTGLLAEAKKTLGHDDFDNWKNVVNGPLTRSGEWCAYEVNPQEGDGILTFYNTRTGKRVEVDRGYRAQFTSNGLWGVALIKPLYAATRQAKIDKKADHEMPSDSLAIVNLRTLEVRKIGSVLNYKIGERGGEWVAFSSCDTTLIPFKSLKEKETGRPLIVTDLPTGRHKITNWVKDYTISKDGKRVALTIMPPDKDSVATSGLGVINLPDTSLVLLDRDKPFFGVPVFDESGTRLAFTASTDSVKTGTRRTSIYLSDMHRLMDPPREIPLAFKDSAGNELLPNQYTLPKFSYNGCRLIGGVAPVIAPDDTTIVDFEKGKLDIWVWNAPLTPSQADHMREEMRKKNYPVSIDLNNMRKVLLTESPYAQVEGSDRWDGDRALVIDPKDNIVSYQWDYFAPTEMELVDLRDGSRRRIGTFRRSMEPEVSPAGKYVAWFDERQWWVYDVASDTTRCVSRAVEYPMWDTDDRHPSPSSPYGIAAWSDNDGRLLVYDRHDIWSLDPRGEKAPECLTAGEGRRCDLRFRYRNLDPERRFLSAGDLMVLDVFDYTNKYNGLATMNYGRPSAPAVGVLDGHYYGRLTKARDAEVFTWTRDNFEETPDIWECRGLKFAQAKQLSDANPQLKDYNWGTAQLERWYAYDGSPSEGVLYVPENYDPAKKYPMLCVFYETGSEDLYRHYTMQPSWSWVNYPFYVSRGYVVFVPDIHYNSGRPGEDAWNYVCSGAEEMCRRYPWIDKDRIGIDGQSWGGYQTAYLVTRTDMFACAGSGAPVSNMTSAYGGIRWESGDSRQPQYEQGQSRIGGDLWSMRDFYVANSPVFRADRVKTPLLIMHNDADGAVPWYQGIELFMALRRLEKPVWMLQYNGEAHNIKARKNRKDITIRLQQFFDHYLKGDPMPRWMKEGIPTLRKGQEWGFEIEN